MTVLNPPPSELKMPDLLGSPLTQFVSQGELDGSIIEFSDYLRENGVQNIRGFIQTVQSYREEIMGMTLGEFLKSLLSFHNNGVCGFQHETGLAVAGILLRPENCKNKEKYAGCGHPEMNGVILGSILGRLLLKKKNMEGSTLSGINPCILSLLKMDAIAPQEYRISVHQMNSDSSMTSFQHLSILQSIAGENVTDMLHNLAGEIRDAYMRS